MIWPFFPFPRPRWRAQTSRRPRAKAKRRAAERVPRVEELEPRILLAGGVYRTPAGVSSPFP